MKAQLAKPSKSSEKHACATADPAYNVACYYGCHIAPRVHMDKHDLASIKSIKALEGDDMFSPAEDKVAVIKAVRTESIQSLPQPITLWTEGTYANKKSKKRIVNVDIVGTDKSIAEATIIQTAISILKEEGLKDLCVHINSIGGRDTIARFQKEITNYYRKNISVISPSCRQIFKKDVLTAHTCAIEEGDEIATKAPQSISYLNEAGRAHFQEVLEFLETLKIDYRVSNSLVGHRGYSSETVFMITCADAKSGESIVAAGSRYDGLAKKLGDRKDIPAVGITLYLPPLSKTKQPIKPLKKSKFFFIQIGFEAKLKSLEVIEILRKAKVPLYQSISRDKLSAQLSIAEHEQFPYVILMGQKEAFDNTVIVRDSSTRSQNTVPVPELASYLKQIS